MNKCTLVLVALFCVALTQTAAQEGHADFDRNANFSHYKTFKWVHIKSAEKLDELTAEQLVGTIEFALEKKGLTKSKTDTADLYIGYQVTDPKDAHSNQYGIGSLCDSVAGANSVNAGASSTVVHTGELTLLLYDGGNKRLVWRCTISSAVDANAKPDKKQKHLDAAVEKLLKDYPPKK